MVFMETCWSVFLWVNGPTGGWLTLGRDPGCSTGQCEHLAPDQCCAVPAETNSPPLSHGTQTQHLSMMALSLCGRQRRCLFPPSLSSLTNPGVHPSPRVNHCCCKGTDEKVAKVRFKGMELHWTWHLGSCPTSRRGHTGTNPISTLRHMATASSAVDRQGMHLNTL